LLIRSNSMSGRNTTPKRPIRIEGDVAYVPLTRGCEACIDSCDVPLVDGMNWYALKRRNKFYAVGWLRKPGGSKTLLLMHRLISATPAGLETDHVDGDGLNNRRENLRHATTAENQCNRGAQKNNTSGRKGITFHKSTGRWASRITMNGKRHLVGYFATPELAWEAYCAAAERIHGEFARAA
jgi:hypothetical protein